MKLSKLRPLATGNLSIFAEKILRLKVEPFHKRWLDFQLQNRHSLILAPRGFGKSSTCTVAYALWKLINNPNTRILIVSNTHSQAQSFLKEIKQHIEQNECFREVFPEFRPGSKWTDGDIELSNKKGITKEPSVSSVGVLGPITSKHCDVLILDDIVTEEVSRTETQRDKLRQWFYMTLMPVLEPGGECHILGTRYNPSDLYGELVKGAYSENHIVDKALKDDGTSLWPDKFPATLLEQMRRDYGSIAFGMQYQNSVNAAQGEIFKYEWIQFYDKLPDGCKIWQGVDLAISQKSSADYFAHVTVGIDANANVYVVDRYRDRLSFQQQVDTIINKHQRHDPVRVGIESNAYQAALSNTLRQHTSVRVHPITTTSDKVTRAQKLSARFEAGKVFFKREHTDLIEELCEFPKGRYDDLFDALEFAVRLGEIPIRKKRAIEPGLFTSYNGQPIDEFMRSFRVR